MKSIYIKSGILCGLLIVVMVLNGSYNLFAYPGSANDSGVVTQNQIVRKIDIADWNDRPTSVTDGDVLEVTDTGALYRWSDIADGWIRSDVYDKSLTLLGSVPYDVDDELDLVNFTETEQNGGVVSYGSGYVDIDITASAAADAWLGVSTTSDSNSGFYLSGYFQTPSAATGGNNYPVNSLIFDTATKLNVLILRGQTTNSPRFSATVNSSVQSASTFNDAVSSSDFTWVELMRTTTGFWYLWLDHSSNPVLIGYDSNSAGFSDAVRIGDFASVASGRMYVRDVRALQF